MMGSKEFSTVVFTSLERQHIVHDSSVSNPKQLISQAKWSTHSPSPPDTASRLYTRILYLGCILESSSLLVPTKGWMAYDASPYPYADSGEAWSIVLDLFQLALPFLFAAWFCALLLAVIDWLSLSFLPGIACFLPSLNVIRKRYCRKVDLDVWHACQNGWAWQNSGCGTQRWWLLVEASVLYVNYILYVSCILKKVDLSTIFHAFGKSGCV